MISTSSWNSTRAKESPKRIVYTEGEDERILRAVQIVVDEGLAKPILIGRPAIVERRIERAHGFRPVLTQHAIAWGCADCLDRAQQ